MLYSVLRQRAKDFPDKIAVAGEYRSFTFRTLLREVTTTISYLTKLKMKPGDFLLLGIPPSPEYYSVFYAAAAIGVAVIPVAPSGKIPARARDEKPSMAAGEQEFLRQAKEACPSVRETIGWNRDQGLDVPQGTTSFHRKRVIRDENVLVDISSGTTGEPVFHFRSAELLLRRSELRIQILGVTPEETLLSTRAFNSGSSIYSHVLLPVVAGCKVVVREKFERFEAARIIARERVTLLYSAPLIFEVLGSIPPDFPADFSSLRRCVSTGAPLPRAVYDEFYRRFGIKIRQCYGATHIYPAMSYNLDGPAGATGRLSGPFPMVLFNEEGRRVPSGEIGEIALDAGKIKDLFWRRQFQNNPQRRGRYVFTGDLGKADSEGNLYILGRKSRFIKVGANRVAPAEVESVLRSHDQVLEAVVFAIHAGQANEAVGAIVVCRRPLTASELQAYCVRHLDSYKCPRQIEFRDSLPRNAQGKVIRFSST
jgi:long-chain acyl-CoA synthetase